MVRQLLRRFSKVPLRGYASSCELPKLPIQFLRDSDDDNFDPETQQRTDIVYDSKTGKPAHDHSQQRYQVESARRNGENYVVEWADGRSSEYSAAWIDEKVKNWAQPEVSTRVLWKGLSESDVRNSHDLTLEFGDVLQQRGMSYALRALYAYGILLVTDTPTDDGGVGIAALAAAISGSPKKSLASSSILTNYMQGGTETFLPNATDGPQRTLYGSVWFTDASEQAEGTSVADSAYGIGGLPLHTDMAYKLTPPGLQIFTMVEKAEQGGESICADGFAAAEALRSEHPRAFELLSSTVRRYHSVDKRMGWHLEATGPVIETRQGVVVSIRHNDLDRLPDLPPPGLSESQCKTFYTELADAHAKWDEILGRDSTRLIMKLQAGETLVVANQRCMHGRYSFHNGHNGSRKVSGCYVDQDELNSRFRMEGFHFLV